MKLMWRLYFLWMLALLAAGIYTGQRYWAPHLRAKKEAEEHRREQAAAVELVDLADQSQARGDWNEAYAYLRRAIDTAPNTTDKALAVAKMGEMLLSRARHDPLAARHNIAGMMYLEDAIGMETDMTRKKSLFNNLAQGYFELQEKDKFVTAARGALDTVDSEDEQRTQYLEFLDQFMDLATWSEWQAFSVEARPLMTNAPYAEQMEMLETEATEKILLDPAWGAEYATVQGGATADPAALREPLLTQVLSEYRALAAANPNTAEEYLFRVARLLFQEDKYDEADQAFQAYLENEASAHIPESAVMMSALARRQKDLARSRQMLDYVLESHPVDQPFLDESLALAADLAAGGQEIEANQFLETIMAKVLAQGRMNELNIEILTRAMEEYSEAARLARVRRLQQDSSVDDAIRFLSDLIVTTSNVVARHSALYSLYEFLARKPAPVVEQLMTGITAVESSPEDPRAIPTMIRLAQTVETMGLPSYAQTLYNRAALLIMTDAGVSSNALLMSLDDGILNTARCMLRNGEVADADHLLRQICNNFNPGQVRSEAAYLWALIAIDSGQWKEAQRRLDLVDMKTAPADLVTRVDLQRQFINLKRGLTSVEILDDLLSLLDALPAAHNESLIREIYLDFFDKWARDGNAEAMRRWLDGGRDSVHADLLPLATLEYQLANSILRAGGLAALERELRANPRLGVVSTLVQDEAFMKQIRQQMEQVRKKLVRWL